MGCFSFMCKVCGKPILSNGFRGEKVHLFLLKGGNVIERMNGEYDSYGRVFDKDFRSIEWQIAWDTVCDLMFVQNDAYGIAAIHMKCFDGELPITCSEDDPDQGWGVDGALLANVDTDLELN